MNSEDTRTKCQSASLNIISQKAETIFSDRTKAPRLESNPPIIKLSLGKAAHLARTKEPASPKDSQLPKTPPRRGPKTVLEIPTPGKTRPGENCKKKEGSCESPPARREKGAAKKSPSPAKKEFGGEIGKDIFLSRLEK